MKSTSCSEWFESHNIVNLYHTIQVLEDNGHIKYFRIVNMLANLAMYAVCRHYFS